LEILHWIGGVAFAEKREGPVVCAVNTALFDVRRTVLSPIPIRFVQGDFVGGGRDGDQANRIGIGDSTIWVLPPI
jgi:hypothetical protein